MQREVAFIPTQAEVERYQGVAGWHLHSSWTLAQAPHKTEGTVFMGHPLFSLPEFPQ